MDAALDAEHRTAIAKLVRAQASSAQFVCTTFRYLYSYTRLLSKDETPYNLKGYFDC